MTKDGHELLDDDGVIDEGGEEQEQDEEVGGILLPPVVGDCSDHGEVEDETNNEDGDVHDAEDCRPNLGQDKTSLDVELFSLEIHFCCRFCCYCY